MALELPALNLRAASIGVEGTRVGYAEAGEGREVLLVPGWSLPARTYAHSVACLASRGFRVVIPEIYGSRARFDLSGGICTAAGLLASFASAVFRGRSFDLVGHSLGGGFSVCLAAHHPEEIRRLVLVSSIGDPTWTDRAGRPSRLSQRPLQDWAGAFVADMVKTRERGRNVPRVIAGSLGELGRNPGRVLQCAMLARRADLRPELGKIASAGIRSLAIWTRDDVVIPRESFVSLAGQLGASTLELPGSHGWIFTSAEEFAAVVGDFLLD